MLKKLLLILIVLALYLIMRESACIHRQHDSFISGRYIVVFITCLVLFGVADTLEIALGRILIRIIAS
ncbi:hypothetical protein F4825DRAFT_433899 [Nemania diffusa]|nr:hypothetical protein F4825DRAFT_433899 [Nemania diffusa]